VSGDFLAQLGSAAGDSRERLLGFLAAAGVSADLKTLQYSRVVGDRELAFAEGDVTYEEPLFSGDRQRDINLAVRQVLNRDGLWQEYVRRSILGRSSGAVIHSIRVVEGLRECSEKAESLFARGGHLGF